MKEFQKVGLLLAIVLGMSGCIGYEEELWVNPDGSGKVQFKIILSEFLAKAMKEKGEEVFSEEQLSAKFGERDGLKIEEAKTY